MSSSKLKALIIIIILFLIVLNIPIIPYTHHSTKTITYTSITPYTTTKIVAKQRVLFEGRNLYISTFSYRYSGPYHLKAGQTITVTWDADSVVNVYIMNEVDWCKRFFGAPTSWRAFGTGRSGTISYTLRYDEPIYIQVMSPAWAAAKLYTWKELLSWKEKTTETLHKTITLTKIVTEKQEKNISILELIIKQITKR